MLETSAKRLSVRQLVQKMWVPFEFSQGNRAHSWHQITTFKRRDLYNEEGETRATPSHDFIVDQLLPPTHKTSKGATVIAEKGPLPIGACLHLELGQLQRVVQWETSWLQPEPPDETSNLGPLRSQIRWGIMLSLNAKLRPELALVISRHWQLSRSSSLHRTLSRWWISNLWFKAMSSSVRITRISV